MELEVSLLHSEQMDLEKILTSRLFQNRFNIFQSKCSYIFQVDTSLRICLQQFCIQSAFPLCVLYVTCNNWCLVGNAKMDCYNTIGELRVDVAGLPHP
jgi:hypothetical protein